MDRRGWARDNEGGYRISPFLYFEATEIANATQEATSRKSHYNGGQNFPGFLSCFF
jgi:hypothetical protein